MAVLSTGSKLMNIIKDVPSFLLQADGLLSELKLWLDCGYIELIIAWCSLLPTLQVKVLESSNYLLGLWQSSDVTFLCKIWLTFCLSIWPIFVSTLLPIYVITVMLLVAQSTFSWHCVGEKGTCMLTPKEGLQMEHTNYHACHMSQCHMLYCLTTAAVGDCQFHVFPYDCLCSLSGALLWLQVEPAEQMLGNSCKSLSAFFVTAWLICIQPFACLLCACLQHCPAWLQHSSHSQNSLSLKYLIMLTKWQHNFPLANTFWVDEWMWERNPASRLVKVNIDMGVRKWDQMFDTYLTFKVAFTALFGSFGTAVNGRWMTDRCHWEQPPLFIVEKHSGLSGCWGAETTKDVCTH